MSIAISQSEATGLVVDILRNHNTSEENALHVAKALVAAEMSGQSGHGLSRVPSYAAQAASGKVDGMAVPQVVAHKSAALRIDAANGFAYPALDLAIAEVTALTAESAIASASIFRSHHFGQAGYHAERLASNGLVALVFGNSPQAIAPWGGSKGLFGTNPIAFAAPRRNDIPLVIDMSLSKAARGKVMVAQQKGEPIPEGWALDEHGKPTTDPDMGLKGTMLPMGEAKGAALVLMVEILSAALSGAHFGYEASSFFSADGPPPGVGQLIIAFDPEFFSGGGFYNRFEVLIEEMLAQENVRLPGARRIEIREKAGKAGINISEKLKNELDALKCKPARPALIKSGD
jgi:(2R)-3-sulfolactate dehydrogenase (NADP+)